MAAFISIFKQLSHFTPFADSLCSTQPSIEAARNGYQHFVFLTLSASNGYKPVLFKHKSSLKLQIKSQLPHQLMIQPFVLYCSAAPVSPVTGKM